MTNVTDESSQSTTEQVKERVQDVAQQAKGETREQLRKQIDTRSTEAGEQVRSTAHAVRRASAQLREEGQETPAKVVDQAADRAERLGTYLTEADGGRILRDVEDFARRQPWLFVGGSAVVGFFASRFMKASSSRRYQEDGYISPAEGPAPASRHALPGPAMEAAHGFYVGPGEPAAATGGASGGVAE
jgi:ElaB/YqjD/DUF883 family membrane-anchored ribosome-binding protein